MKATCAIGHVNWNFAAGTIRHSEHSGLSSPPTSNTSLFPVAWPLVLTQKLSAYSLRQVLKTTTTMRPL